jgi:RimJ/RimL family protein N-acetyltransferase
MKAISAGRLQLEPLARHHAEVMYPLLSDPRIYEFLDYGPPPSPEHLVNVYRQLEERHSPDGSEQWLNWVVLAHGGIAVGYVQATVISGHRAWVAFVLGPDYWGRGYGRASTGAMLEHLAREHGVTQFLACAERGNIRSLALLRSLSFELASPEQAAQHALTNTEILLVRRE